jgi:hypothetical protein
MNRPEASVLGTPLGALLHVQGTTEIQWEGAELRAFAGAERLWRVHVERGWRRRGAGIVLDKARVAVAAVAR